jgi:hypothetical protein
MEQTGMEPSTMGGASQFAMSFNVPPEFAEILRGLTKEILRDQPKDLNKFAYEYFANLLQAQQIAAEK